jgi:hypothetical protein
VELFILLTLLFLLHRENGDFSILMKDIILLTLAHCIALSILLNNFKLLKG